MLFVPSLKKKKALPPSNSVVAPTCTTVWKISCGERPPRLTEVKADKALIELRLQKGELVEFDFVASGLTAEIAAIKEKLSQLAGGIDVGLPSSFGQAVRKQVRETVEKTVKDIFFDLAEIHTRILSDDDDDDE